MQSVGALEALPSSLGAAAGAAGTGSHGATAGDVNGVAFSPDPITADDEDGEGPGGNTAAQPEGYRVATAHRDGRVRVWEVSARRGRAAGTGGGRGATGAPPPPGRMSMSGAAAATLKNGLSFKGDGGGQGGGSGGSKGPSSSSVVVEGSRVVAVLEGHSGDVFSVAWAPDGERISTGSADKTARVWRVERRTAADEEDAANGIEDGAGGLASGLLGEPSEARSVSGHHGPPSAESSAARGLMYASGGLGGISSRRRLHKLRTLDR